MSDIFDKEPEIFKTNKQFKEDWISACREALEHLLVVLRSPILGGMDEDLSADRLKNAVQTKKIAAFEFLDILQKVDAEELNLNEGEDKHGNTGFAERKTK